MNACFRGMVMRPGTNALLSLMLAFLGAFGDAHGQEPRGARASLGLPIEVLDTPVARTIEAVPPGLSLPPTPAAEERPMPINLSTALQLAGVNPLEIAFATQRLEAANAALQRANVLWLPTVYLGIDYFRHDGRLQDVVGTVFSTSKSTFMVGAGPSMVFAVTDAIYGPLSAQQVASARRGEIQAARNDSMFSVADTYFQVQQARGEVAGSLDVLRRMEELAKRIDTLVEGLSPPLEKNRVLSELSRRRQVLETSLERWQTASAELNRLLRLNPSAIVEPLEAPHLRVELIDLTRAPDELIPMALANRPELESNQALLDASLVRVRQEKVRPFLPTVMVRGAATNPGGTLSSGYFGGGINGDISNFSARNTMDVQLLWEFQNLGFGNRAQVRAREAESQLASLTLSRTQDLVASEVVQAHAQATRAVSRLRQAEEGLKNALTTAEKSIEGLKQTRLIGGTVVLVFRPLEVVAAIQALDQAYRDFYGATADTNRAQFRLYRAIGQPASCLASGVPAAK